MGSILLENVKKWNRKEEILIEIKKILLDGTQKALIIGDAVSGKEQLFDLMTGTTEPDEGLIVKKGKIAVINQEFPYLRGLRVKDYIRLTLRFLNYNRGIELELEKIMRNYDIWEIREQKVESLRKYSCFRVMVVLALIQKPEIVLIERYQPILNYEKKVWEYVKRSIGGEKILLVCFSDTQVSAPFFDTEHVLENGKIRSR